MKDPQLQFFGKLGRVITPATDQPEPRLWFRELRILRQLEPGEANEIRRIELRRGLNIVWAPPEEGDEPELYGDGLSGHASGKTLFCRILRYLLGEKNYGPDALEKAVEDRFTHELWAVAEVFVDGELWLTARPLAGAAHRFAVKGATIDELLAGKVEHGDFDDFLTAIEETVCAPVAEAAEGNEQFRWRYLLPWLARDQECRFSSLTEWRSSLAESDNPQTSAAAQQELVKAVLGMLNAEELVLRGELAAAEATIKQSNEELPSLERTEKRDHRKLLEALRRANLENLSGDETIEQLKERKQLRAEGLKMAIDQDEQDAKLVTARAAWERAVKYSENVDGQIKQADQALRNTTEKLAKRASRYQLMRAAGIENPARMEQGFCPHTLEHAKTRGCVTAPPGSSLETAINLGAILTEGDELEQSRKEQEKQVAELKVNQAQSATSVVTANDVFSAEKSRVDRSTAQAREWQQLLNATTTLLETAEESATSAAQCRGALTAAMKQKDEAKTKAEVLRKAHEHSEQQLSDAFADAVRAAMGGKVEPTVSITERGFNLSVKRKGDLTGAALETIKVLAFDLAALVLSVEGIGHHPRFLIHDGPREADMARVIYERFFLYARKLEQCFVEPQLPNFQYIITTTTHPPKDMREGSAWLRMTLNTTKTEERLLREDL